MGPTTDRTQYDLDRLAQKEAAEKMEAEMAENEAKRQAEIAKEQAVRQEQM